MRNERVIAKYGLVPGNISDIFSEIKDKPTLQSFKSSILRINLVDLKSDNCGSCLICSS